MVAKGKCCDSDSAKCVDVDARSTDQKQHQQLLLVEEDLQQQPQEQQQSASAAIVQHGSVNVSTIKVVPSESCHVSANCIPIDDGQACIQVTDDPTTTTGGCIDSPAPIPVGTPESNRIQIVRKLVSECLGTCLLEMIVVGSGISGETLSEDNVGVQLLINSVATMGGLYCLITILGPVSGAHLNPIVSMVDTMYGDMPTWECCWYSIVQCLGGIVGSVLANIMYDIATTISTKSRFGYNVWISEIIATATLILVIHGCIRTGNESSVPPAVSVWVGGGYFFTSSSIFANPAVTIGRIFTNTFAGIEPKSAVVYICFQFIGGICGYGLVRFLYPAIPSSSGGVSSPIIASDDPLYRRVYVLVNQEFFTNNNTYATTATIQDQPTSSTPMVSNNNSSNNNNNPTNNKMISPSSVASC
jgi:glycerol uptake facilitator-like aquaporin